MATFNCACGRSIRFDPADGGRRARCRWCGHELTLPVAAAPHPPVPERGQRRGRARTKWWVVALGAAILYATYKIDTARAEAEQWRQAQAAWVAAATQASSDNRQWTAVAGADTFVARTRFWFDSTGTALVYEVTRRCAGPCWVGRVYEITWQSATGAPLYTVSVPQMMMPADTSGTGLSLLVARGARPVDLDAYLSASRWEIGYYPAGASAICADGWPSFSASRRGTCSHHGGVARWLP